MKLSTRGRYGLRALIDLAVHEEEEAVSIQSIAGRQGISESYLEQLVRLLKKGGAGSKRAGCRRRLPAGQAGGHYIGGRYSSGSGRQPASGKLSCL